MNWEQIKERINHRKKWDDVFYFIIVEISRKNIKKNYTNMKN